MTATEVLTDALRLRRHDALETVVAFPLHLTCRTGLHIGSGRSPELVGSDLPVLRDAAGRPLVPGSSLRGVLRSGIEAICRSLDLDGWIERATSDGETEDGLAGAWRAMSPVDRLFGRVAQSATDPLGSYASRVQISDLAVVGDPAPVELRDGVAIERESRTAGGGLKFDHEVVPAGTTFAGRVRLKNPADHEVGLLAQSLAMLDEGLLLLGGKSARGLGWVAVAVGEPRVLSARSLLFEPREGAPTGELGSVEEKLGRYLDALRTLVDGIEPTNAGETP